MKLKSIAAFGLTAAALAGCSSPTTLTTKDAVAEVDAYYKKISPTEQPLQKDISGLTSEEFSELPDIDKSYPFKVQGHGDIDAEIFVSPEKAGNEKDGILIELAEEFNGLSMTIDGETVSVSVRSIPSGTAAEYISTRTHVPDGYTPSNPQWNYMLESSGFNTTKIADRLFGNTSGLLIKKEVHERMSKNGGVTIDNLVKEVVESDTLLGYTNPYSSSTGLSLLTQVLTNFDADNPISDKAKAEFQKFQGYIPSTFVTTSQLRESAKSGLADILSISYQTQVNTPEFSNYVYEPFGIRQDSPLYATTKDSKKQQVLKLFSEHVLSEKSQARATSYGFNQLDDYKFEETVTDGDLLRSMQQVWKQNKNGGRPIAGVFVADVSGSMEGEPINNLKRSLLNSLKYIGEGNKIGLVSYDHDVYINVPLAGMDNTQRAYLTNAIKSLEPGGNTATYDATLVAIKMLLAEREANPDVKPVIFVLSDGETNSGYSFKRLEPIVQALGITVNTIGYNADLSELEKLSKINESVSIDASSDDVVYKLKELFNAEF